MLAPVGNHAVIQEARSAGLDACLVKPVRQSSLYDALVNVMCGQSIEKDAQEGRRADAVARSSAVSRGSVLLVEDNLVNQAVAIGMLNKLLGYNVTVANNGREAVDAYEQHSFDLILMDCHMPEMDGFQAAREIRKREASSGKRVPIIALTANAMAQDREDCLNAGMDDHLGKPFSRLQMQDMLNRWMPRQSLEAPAEAAMPSKLTQPPSTGVVDRRILCQLRDLQNKNDPDLLGRVINLYVRESPNEIAKLAQALTSGDLAQVGCSAHSLKSSSANVGATVLSQQCAEMQSASRTANLEAARRLYTKVTAEHGHVITALNAELAVLAQS